MANGDGFSEVGGGGSVLYRVQIKKGDPPNVSPTTPGKLMRTTNGKDEYDDGQPRDHYFEIAIKLPSPGYALQGKLLNNTLLIYLPISKSYDPDQTKVSWAVKTLPGGLTNVTV